MNLHRNARAMRFGAIGLVLGIGLYVGLVLITNLFAVLTGALEPKPSNIEEMQTMAINTVIFGVALGFVGVLLGALTSGVSARIRGVKLLGVLCILTSAAIGAWLTMQWVNGAPTAEGLIIGYTIVLGGLVTGRRAFKDARRTIIERL